MTQHIIMTPSAIHNFHRTIGIPVKNVFYASTLAFVHCTVFTLSQVVHLCASHRVNCMVL